MRLDITGIKEQVGERLAADVALTLAPAAGGGDELAFPEPCTGRVTALNTGTGIAVTADLAGEAELTCARCLVRYRYPFTVHFAEEYRQVEGVATDAIDQEIEEPDGHTYVLYHGNEIDLSEVVRQNVLLALPMKPLCTEACRGLCPVCGQNRNEADCGCAGDRTDPRLEALAEWKKRNS